MHAGLSMFTLGHTSDNSGPDFPKYVCFNLLVMKWDQQDFSKAYVTSEKEGYPTYIP